MKNCIIAQSGGPTTAINASIAGVLIENQTNNYFNNVYGALNGITGILNHRIINLTDKVAADNNFISKLKITPAMYLGSCRYKLPNLDNSPDTYQTIFSYFEQLEIDTFFYVGGNDSMDTVLKLSEYAKQINSPVKVLGIPKTIDNDLCHTDHTPGYGSAAKYIATSLLEIAHDTCIYPLQSVTVVEIMGRDAGWLTAASALARNKYNVAPHLIYLPERDFDLDQCIADTKELLKSNHAVVIAISEGLHDKDGNYISASGTEIDHFGHCKLSGAGKSLEQALNNVLDTKVRSVELSVLQRAAAHCASLCDLDESVSLGQQAVCLSQENKSGYMATIERLSDQPYQTKISSCNIEVIANEVKQVPDSYINAQGNNITQEFIDYALPLIQGEPDIPFENGIPSYLDISHLV